MARDGVMPPLDFKKALENGEAGRRVRLVFCEGAIGCLAYFFGMLNNPGALFTVSSDEALSLRIARMSRNWRGGEEMRTVVITLTKEFAISRDYFERRMSNALEKIEHVVD